MKSLAILQATWTAAIFFCRCIAVENGQGRAFTLRRLSSQKEDPAAFTAWTPPPDYALNTVGHKTMYLVDVSVGSRGQTFRLLVDTGSPWVILPGALCDKCRRHFQTSEAEPGNRTLSVKFGLGSVSGHVFADSVCVDASEGLAPLAEVGFLQRSKSHIQRRAGTELLNVEASGSAGTCAKTRVLVADDESDDLARLPFDGILGLGLESSSDVDLAGNGFSFLWQLVDSGAAKDTTFALRLSNDAKSQLLLGGVDESKLAGGRAVWVPLSLVADGSWQFSIQDLTLDGQEQHFGGFEAVIDSGTSLLAADDDLRDWFRQHLLPKDCDAVDNLPKLGFQIHGGSILSLLPADYIDRRDGQCNLALMPSKLQSVGGQRLVLGDSFMRRYTTIFDRQNRRLGFGIAADEAMTQEMLPAMFPTQTTTVAPATTQGAPPPEHLDYGRLQYIPVTTPPPPTAEEVEAARTGADLNNAFSGLGDDLADTFEHKIAQEKTALDSQNPPSSLNTVGPEQA